jgi:hypothetical protein
VHVLAGRIGTDVRWGLTHPERLRAHGLTDVEADLFAPPVRGGTDAARLWLLSIEQVETDLLNERLVTPGDLAAVRSALADPSFVDVFLAVFTAWGRRTRS